MTQVSSLKPLIRPGWLRVIAYLVSLIVIFLVTAGIFLIGFHKGNLDPASIKGFLTGNNLSAVALVVFMLSLTVTFAFRRWIDKKTFISLGLDFRGHGREAIAGLSLSVFIVCISTMILKITGHLKWMDILFDPKALFIGFGSVVLISFYEELIFRGYIMNNLMEAFPNWVALMISSLLFMIFHWTTIGFFPLLNVLIMGLIMGLNYIYTKNLWFSICFHVGWKFFQGPVLGFSGEDNFQTLLQTELNGDINVTGGANGLEGSMILSIISLLSLIALYLIFQRKVSQQSQPVPGRI